MKFRVPRKIKKKIKKDIWFYPKDNKDCYLVCFPRRSQQEYDDWKQGKVWGALADVKNKYYERRNNIGRNLEA